MIFCAIFKIFKSIFFTERFRWMFLEISYELSLFIAYDNDESCHCMVRIGSIQRLFHFIACVSFLSISFFFSYFFVDFATCLGIQVSLSILQIKQWSCFSIPKWSLEGWVAASLLSIINVTGLVQFGEKLSYILPPLVSLELLAAEYYISIIYSLLLVL